MTLAFDFHRDRGPIAPGLVGTSRVMAELRHTIAAVARTRLPVLIQGPTGAGKELVAEALHVESSRRGAFVPFNVCALSDSMFEDALFGHVRGAFTGAVADTPGFLREADGGTVFLDEVSGLSPSLQPKLLRAVEIGVFRPVGAKHDAQSDFRVVSATNQRLDELVADGSFRADLAFRLSAVTVRVPALVERLDDIPQLVRHFLDRMGAPHMKVESAAMEHLSAHNWTGNVRELRHVVEWSAAFSNGQIAASTVRLALAQRTASQAQPLGACLASQRAWLRAALDRHDWDTRRLAMEMGINRATLYRRMKRAGLQSNDRESGTT